ncbi:MAG: glycosyltransferase [Blastocatellales bacterium]
MFLVSALRPKTIVELGARDGDFYCALCQASKDLRLDARCFAIDTWRGNTQASPDEEKFLAGLRDYHDPLYGGFSSLIPSAFDDALPQFADGEIDLLHINGAHNYEAARRDFESWTPKISDRGVVLFQDTNVRERGFGVWRLWEEVKAKRPHFEFVHGRGLGVLAAGQTIPAELRSLLNSSPEEAAAIREFFFRLGRELAEKQVHADQSRQAKQHEQALIGLRKELSEKDRAIEALNSQILGIVNSRGWIMVNLLWRIRSRLFPRKSSLARLLNGGREQIAEERLTKGEMLAVGEANEAEPLLVSIIIPVYNALIYTQQCIESLYAKGARVSFEIIVVDDASTDGTNEWLGDVAAKYDNFSFLRNAENSGFAHSVNRGVQRSSGKYVVILNNDTLVTPNWLDKLIEAAERDDSIGVISPVTNYVGEGPQLDDAAHALWPTEADAYAGAVANCNDIFYEPRRLVFFCVLIRRAVFNAIGLLDERYGRGNFEDDDYCLRARMAQFKLAVARNSFVYHHGSKTFEANNISHDELMERNRDIYYKKVSDMSGHLYSASGKRSFSDDCAASVIVRTLDRPNHLRNALASLANQTWKDFEVVLVNDGGARPQEALDCFSGLLKLIYVERQKTGGRTSALNDGIRNSKGRYITYLDDDDVVYPWRLEVMVREVSGGKSLYAYSDYNRALVNGSQVTTIKAAPSFDYDRNYLMVENYIPIHCWIHSRDVIDRIGGFDESLDLLEDWDFLLRLSSICDFQHVRIPTCEYRFSLDGANSLTTHRRRSLAAIRQVYEKHPTQDAEVTRRRNERLLLFQQQLSQMESIMTQIVVDKGADQEVALQQAVKLITGF